MCCSSGLHNPQHARLPHTSGYSYAQPCLKSVRQRRVPKVAEIRASIVAHLCHTKHPTFLGTCTPHPLLLGLLALHLLNLTTKSFISSIVLSLRGDALQARQSYSLGPFAFCEKQDGRGQTKDQLIHQ